MSTNTKIKTKIQKLQPGALVELFTIDLSPIGESTTYSFTNGTMDNGDIVAFGGIEYIPLPVEAEGFEQTGEGKLPRPIIRVSNITGVFINVIVQYNDLVGCELTRRRTFYQYLDGGSSPDSDALFPIDQFIIDRKTKQNKFLIEWELVASLDIENVYLPRKQAFGICTHRYRTYINDAFDNASVNYTTDKDPLISCPYQGTEYFTSGGASTEEPEEDSCGRTLYHCKLRYGTVVPLPFEGFPNIKRFLRYKR
jgi:lambda family phage minor tail protein L